MDVARLARKLRWSFSLGLVAFVVVIAIAIVAIIATA
jgi:hypothetical protein